MNSYEPNLETGLARLLDNEARLETLRDARVGFLGNPTSVTADLTHAVDALVERGVEPVRLFGPEHGVRAAAQDMEAVDQSTDPVTGIPTVSLYGDSEASLRPSREAVADLDVVIADIQDVGARYYTYASTVGFMMEACGRVGTEVWVLDRPNPIRGDIVEGNVVGEGYRSFVGTQPLANRHGMTVGELAHFYDRFGGWSCDLEVVEMEGWRRSMWYDETGLPWVMPSPNMPTLETAIVYPGLCLLEGLEVSEGRGTTRPFELFGAPYVNARELRDRLRELAIPGAAWREVAFRPMFQKHAGRTCRGVQLHVTDRDAFASMAAGYAAVGALAEVGGEAFGWRTETYEFVDDRLAIDLLVGDPELRRRIVGGEDPMALDRAAAESTERFLERRGECLLYPENEGSE